MENHPGNTSAKPPKPTSSTSEKTYPLLPDQQPTQDLHYLLNLGVPVDNIAHRIGRTTTAVRHHLKEETEQMEHQP